MKIGDIISGKETLSFHHRLLHIPEPFFRVLISRWLPCTCLDLLRSKDSHFLGKSFRQQDIIEYLGTGITTGITMSFKRTAILAFSFLRRWSQDFSLGVTSWGWVPNKQIFLAAFLHEHPRLWTEVHKNTGKCRSEETSGCQPIQPLPQTVIKYSKFLRA